MDKFSLTQATRTYSTPWNGSAILYAPVVYKAIDDLTSSVIVQNNNLFVATTVSLDFYNQDGSLRTTYSLGSINATRAVEVSLSSISQIPSGWVGSVRIVGSTTSGAGLSAIVTTANTTSGNSAYNAIWQPSGNVYIPYAAKDGFFGLTSTYIVHNTSATGTCDVTAYYYDAPGPEVTAARETFTLGPKATTIRPQVVNGNLPGFWNGSIVLQASCGTLAVVTEANMSNSISAFNGIGK